MLNLTIDKADWAGIKHRLQSAERVLMDKLVRLFTKQVRSKIPKVEWMARYRKALRVYSVMHSPRSFCVAAEMKVDPKDLAPLMTAIYVQSASNPKYAKSVAMLMKHSPWSMADIPVVTGGLPINGYVRIVRRAEIRSLEAKNRSAKESVVLALKEDGLQVNENTTVSFMGDMYFDLGFMIIRAEFGVGVPKMPHWRPALMWLNKSGMKEVMAAGGTTEFQKRFSGPASTWESDSRKIGEKPWSMKKIQALAKRNHILFAQTFGAATSGGTYNDSNRS